MTVFRPFVLRLKVYLASLAALKALLCILYSVADYDL
jgi:hypothetical protein